MLRKSDAVAKTLGVRYEELNLYLKIDHAFARTEVLIVSHENQAVLSE